MQNDFICQRVKYIIKVTSDNLWISENSINNARDSAKYYLPGKLEKNKIIK